MSILDTIIENHGGPKILSENHNTDSIKFDLPDFDKDMQRQIDAISPGGWDAAEYGITREEAVARIQAANTPEARVKVIADLKQRALRRASLDVTGGRVSVFVAGKPPWHGLGVHVADALDSADAIKLANLDWEVLKVPMSYEVDGVSRQADDVFAIVRGDTKTKLGTVGKVYKPIQNADGFAFLDDVLKVSGARYESAGAIFGGSQVWMLAHLPKQRFKVNGKDSVEPYVLFTASHDGKSADRVLPTTLRVECANTFRIATREGRGKGISIPHRGDIKAKIADAQAALGLVAQEFTDFKDAAEVMARTPLDFEPYVNNVLDQVLEVTEAQALMGADALAAAMKVTEANRELVQKKLQKDIDRRNNILNDIMERYENERNGVAGMRGTAWAGFNAVTEHADFNTIGRQRGTQHERQSRRFESVLTGDMDDLKQLAYREAVAVTRR